MKYPLNRTHCGYLQDERSKVLDKLVELEATHKELESRISLLSACNPETLKELKELTNVCRDSANRWTDNLFTVKTFVVDKFGIERSDFDKNFSVPEEFDYVVEQVTPECD